MVIVNNNIYYKINLNIKFTGVAFGTENKVFRKNDIAHRYYGPAYIMLNYKQWIFNGKTYGSSHVRYNQKQFLKDLDKQWLL